MPRSRPESRASNAGEACPVVLGQCYGVFITDPDSALSTAWMQREDGPGSPSSTKRSPRNVTDRVPATIEQRRPLRSVRDSFTSLATIGDATAEEYEYYVNYIGFDRRLDEWVSTDRLDIAKGPLPNSKRRSLERQILQAPSSTHAGGCAGTPGMSQGMMTQMSQGAMSQTQGFQPKNIQKVHFGLEVIMDAWYYSPYGDECIDERTESIWVCEFCLRPMKNRRTLVDLHMPTCVLKHPPGREIYREEDPPSAAVGAGAGAAKRSSPHRSSKRDGSSSSSSSSLTPNAVVYEVNGGGMDKVYCQHLSLLGKLFLQHKSVTFDVDYFNFYVLCEVDAATGREHFVGFFSKEKNSSLNHNLACLLVLPSHQGKSYGKLLISVSYELSKREGNFLASPEKPLSDLAKTTYDRYWAFAVFKDICNRGVNQGCTYDDIVLSTGISLVDVFNTLEKLMDPQHTHSPISIVEGNQVSEVFEFFEPASPGFGSPPKRPKNGKRRTTVPYVKTVEFRLDAQVLHRLGSYFDISAPKIRLCNPSCFH